MVDRRVRDYGRSGTVYKVMKYVFQKLNESLRHSKKLLFWAAVVLYFSGTNLQLTVAADYAMVNRICTLLRILAMGMAGLKLLSDFEEDFFSREGHGFVSDSYSIRVWISFFVILFFSGISSWLSQNWGVFFSLLLVISSYHIRMSKIMKTAVLVQGMLFVSVLFMARFGIINNLLTGRSSDGYPNRQALGFIFPSVASDAYFFLIVLFLWVKNGKITIIEFTGMEVINLLIYCLTDSRVVFFLIMPMLILVPLASADRGAGIVRKILSFRVSKVLCDGFAVILSALALLFSHFSDSQIVEWLDVFLSRRLWYSHQAFSLFGISAFGQKIEWIGFGGVTFEQMEEVRQIYNFVDSSYPLVLINYGVVFFLITVILMVITTGWVRKNGSPVQLILFLAVLLHCLIEPRLIEVQQNALLFLIVPAICDFVSGCRKAKLQWVI